MSYGKYVVLEGADGTGKTTMSGRLQAWLQRQGINTLCTRHPGSTPFGQEIRRLTKTYSVDPITEALLFAVDNSNFTHQLLKPSLEKGTWVIADRNNFISSLAYQIASGCSISDLDRVHDCIQAPPKMDLLIILRADASTVHNRIVSKDDKSDKFEKLMGDNHNYFLSVMKAYDMMLDERDEEFQLRLSKFVRLTTTTPTSVPRCIGVNANRDVDQVFASVCDAVSALF